MKKYILVFIGFSLVLFSCSEKVAKKDVLSKAQTFYKKGDYSEARKYIKEAIYKTEGITTKELLNLRYMLANSYFLDRDYVDAIVEFEEFLALFPTAPQIPEVLYKLAYSYMQVAPGAERDLTYVEKAIEKAEELIENYPESEYASKAQEIIKKGKLIEAKHLLEIANLYEHLGKYYGAYMYYQQAYDEYSDVLEKEKLEYKIGENLLKTKIQYQKDIQSYQARIKALEKKISLEKDIEKKNVLINRKNLLEKQLSDLKSRIEKAENRGKAILEYIIKTYPESIYAEKAKKLLKEEKR